MRLRQAKPDQPTSSARGSHQTGLSARDAWRMEGDDLTRARTFCAVAGTEMVAIIDADRDSRSKTAPVKGRDPVWLCERLSLIQREAKRARARAVYRSAQDVLGLIQRRNTHMPIDWTRVDGRLFVLNKLLGQYETGLSDIEALDQAADDRHEPDAPGVIRFDPVHELAKETLVSLLPHASDDEQAALQRLIKIDLTPAIDADPAPSATVAETVSEDLTMLLDTPAQIGSVPIDWIMSDLVQRLLCVGRDYGKVLCVSHSLDDVRVADGTLNDVDARLFERLSELIAGSLPLQGVGRLDIGPSPIGLIISGSGFQAFDIPLPERLIEADETTETPSPAPRITDDTETELRAQLAALMDGGLPTT